MNNTKIPVVIMAGGLGTRAQSIDSTVPKPLIKINNKPILQYEIECLVNQGYTDIILTVSFKAEQIISYFGDGSSFGCKISYFNESTPLGNAGALFKMLQSGQLKDGDFFLLNADSMFDIDFDRFYEFHRYHHARVSLFVHPNNYPYDSGLIITDSDNRVVSWLTKEDKRPEWYKNCVNAGLHCLSATVLQSMIDSGAVEVEKIGQKDENGKVIKVDLDRQILKPNCTIDGSVYAYSSPEYVKDMGTPERFEQVKSDLMSGLVHSRNLSIPQKAIFLDRDGTINRYVGFLRDIDDFELLPSVTEAIKLINQSGHLAIIVTNQPVIARGEVSWESLQLIHNKMETLLGHAGAYIDDIYICPHHPDKGFEGEVRELKFDCDCRKTKPGLLIQAASDYNIDLENSYMIGDSWRDIAAGQAAGCHTVLLTGDGTENAAVSTVDRIKVVYGGIGREGQAGQAVRNEINDHGYKADFECDNLLEAVKKIL